MDFQFLNILVFRKGRASLLLRKLVRACRHICCETMPKTLGVESELSFVGIRVSTVCFLREGARDAQEALTGTCGTGGSQAQCGSMKILRYGASHVDVLRLLKLSIPVCGV